MSDTPPARHVEEPLVGDGVTVGIVRIADTVRRPVRPYTATIHSYLNHLHAAGFSDAPRPLGYDHQGREILTYIPGQVPREPLPEGTAGDDVLAALGRLVRRLHDAAITWAIPAGAVFSTPPAPPPVDLPPLFDRPELVSHRDYCPGNVVFRHGLPAALIDFDLARPTTRLLDVANALYWWAPLLDPVDRAPPFRHVDVPARVAVFADAYGLDDGARCELVPTAAAMIDRMYLAMGAAAGVDPVFARFWKEGVKDRLPRAQAWLAAHGNAIAGQLVG